MSFGRLYATLSTIIAILDSKLGFSYVDIQFTILHILNKSQKTHEKKSPSLGLGKFGRSAFNCCNCFLIS